MPSLGNARAGGLNRWIEIQYRVDVQDEAGQPIPDWRRLCRAKANVESSDTVERFRSDREVGTKLKWFTIRWRSDIVAKQRIKYENEYYNIRSIKEVERRGRHQFMELLGESIEGATG